MSPAEAVEEAIASTRLEGLELPPEFLADAQLFAEGKIDSARRSSGHDERRSPSLSNNPYVDPETSVSNSSASRS
ncbi:MAG: antitoxin VbhA family protein [Acidimicrobiia bacterium]|nr:antitoxin VbhA family protein [Acidimicrobiia bacterium]